MKNLLRIRIASSITMLCCILAFTACSQPVKQNSSHSTQQQNGGGTGGNNGGQQNGGKDSNSPTYTVYLRNASTNSAITFWYVKEIDNEDVTYYSYIRINPGERGYIANIPGNKKYKVNSKVESLSDPSDWTAKAFDELYLDEDKYLVVY